MKTPYYLIHEDILQENIRSFSDGMKQKWKQSLVSYSVKTNSLPWVIRFMNEQRLMMEVVSDEEYELARICGCAYSDIIYNGPIKGKTSFLDAIHNGSYVNIDSSREIEWIKNQKLENERIGLRVNVPVDLFTEGNIEYTEDGFRFGFAEADRSFETALEALYKTGIKKIGLHLHCNSITRAPDVYRIITKYAVDLIERYGINLLYLDVGGGFFGGVPGKATPAEYFEIITEEIKKSKRTEDIILISEPGSALIGTAVDLVTSVIDVKDTAKARIVTTDGSRLHIDPLWKKNRYLYDLETREKRPIKDEQIVCGYTCMDHDRLMKIYGMPELQQGDKIIYHRVGAYSMTFGGMFIRYLPEVYVERKTGIEKIRDRITVQDYYRIQSQGDL